MKDSKISRTGDLGSRIFFILRSADIIQIMRVNDELSF